MHSSTISLVRALALVITARHVHRKQPKQEAKHVEIGEKT
jgi:hypothetical protein